MRIELKKLKHYPQRSEETIAYDAELWVDGVRVGTSGNDGHGGVDDVRLYRNELGIQIPALELDERLHAYAISRPPTQTPYGPLSLSGIFDVTSALAEEEIRAREDQKFIERCRKKGEAPWRVLTSRADEWQGSVSGDALIAVQAGVTLTMEAARRVLPKGTEIVEIVAMLPRPATIADALLLGDIDKHMAAVWSDVASDNGSSHLALPGPRQSLVDKARAAEKKLARIARTRRPTEEETNEARAAYAAASND